MKLEERKVQKINSLNNEENLYSLPSRLFPDNAGEQKDRR